MGVFANFQSLGLRRINALSRETKTAKQKGGVVIDAVLYSIHIRFIVQFISICFRLFDHSFDQSICLRHFVVSSQTQLVS